MDNLQNHSFTPGQAHPKADATVEAVNRSLLASCRPLVAVGVGIVLVVALLLFVPAIGWQIGLVGSMTGFYRALGVALTISAAIAFLLHRQNKASVAKLRASLNAQHEIASASRVDAIRAAKASGKFDRWS
ncbi:MAG: hypothetical protein AAF092_04360 [Pseudomonadota bacterium]